MDTSAPLRMTEPVMQQVIRACRQQIPAEACGFVVADKENPDLGVSIRPMRNVHPDPAGHYRMDNDRVVATYRMFDETGEEPVAVYHSHPLSEPLMSPMDREEARDASLAYMIISFAGGKTSARAYRVRHFVGNT